MKYRRDRPFWHLRRQRHELEAAVDEELRVHLEMRMEELVADGLSPEAARRMALRQFGDLEYTRRYCRNQDKRKESGMRWNLFAGEVAQDLRNGARQIARSAGFTAVAVLTLALGIGATTAIFSAVNAIVLRPLPVPQPERLVLLWEVGRGQGRSNVSAGNFVDIAAEQDVFSSLAATAGASMTLTRDDAAERVSGVRVSAGFFDVWGIVPELGRVFTAADDVPGHDQVVVLSHRFWNGQFGGDPQVLGRSITLDARPYTVIGVMPSSFDFTAESASLWVPIAFTPERKAMHDEHYLTVYGRLRDAVSPEQAQQQLNRIAANLRERFPKDNGDRELIATPLLDTLVGGYREALFIQLGAVALVLLIACGNVSILLLARGAARAREMALRSALGAGQGRLVRQLFTESLVLGLVSALAGVGVARLFIGLLVAYGPRAPRIEHTHVDAMSVGFAALLAIASSLIFGLVPAWRTSKTDINSTLKKAGRGGVGAGGRDVVRSTLIATEVALTLVLLVGAGLLIRSAIEAQKVPFGFDPHGVFAGRFSLPATKYASSQALLQTVEAIEAATTAVPGVTHAAIASNVPGVGTFSNGLVPEGVAQELQNVHQSMARFVSPGYFRAMALPIIRGRGFESTDREGSPLVIIVNQTLAERLWPDQDPIGRRVNGSAPGGPKVVIGVVADVRWRGPAGSIDPEFYQPLAQLDDMAWGWTSLSLFAIARTDGDPAALASGVTRAVASVDANVPLFNGRTMEERMAARLDAARVLAMLLATLGVVALLLAAIGIYGVIAYFVTQRTSEISLRLALGASRASVLRLMVRQAAVPVGVGVVIGVVGAVGATRVIASQLVNVRSYDPFTFLAAAVVLAMVALVAALIPARRAASLDPTRALQG